MRKMESIKRLVVLQLSTIGMLIQIAAYGFIWFKYYEKAIKLVFWERGNWLVIAIYAVLLFFFMTTYRRLNSSIIRPLCRRFATSRRTSPCSSSGTVKRASSSNNLLIFIDLYLMIGIIRQRYHICILRAKFLWEYFVRDDKRQSVFIKNNRCLRHRVKPFFSYWCC
mgnify:CR=1 FL=1